MALNISAKNVGDQLTATEFNRVVEEVKKVHPIGQELGGVLQDFTVYSKLNGTADAVLEGVYYLRDVGDSVEWEGRFTGSHFSDGLGLIGYKQPFNKNIIGYYNKNTIYLRGNDTAEAYTVWEIPGGVDDFQVIKIEVVTDGWQLSVNGVVVSVQPKATDVVINNIGDSYESGNPVKADLKYVSIQTSSGSLKITDLANYSGSANVLKIVYKKGETYPDTFVSYDPAGGPNAAGLFTVYVKYAENSLFYAGYKIAHILDTNIRADLWRIYGADLFEYREGGMYAKNKTVITSQESECTFSQRGKTDFTGGYHGDEKLTDVKFFVNGIPLDSTTLVSAFELLPAKEFYFIQKSNMLETDNDIETVIALHDKKTAIKDSGYYTFNRIEFQESITVQTAYISGITCVSKDQAETVFSENFNYVQMVQDEVEKINEVGARELNYYSNANKLGCVVTSRFLKPAAYDTESKLIVWDSSFYSKYYRRLSEKIVSVGEVWEGETTVTHYKR
jgi:hypothetical protein